MPTAAQRLERARHIDPPGASARHHQQVLLHAHEDEEGIGALGVCEAVRQQRHFIHIVGGFGGGDRHARTVNVVIADMRQEVVHQRALIRRQAANEEARDDIQVGALPEEPGDSVRIRRSGAGKGEPPRILVDAQEEERRLKRGDRQVARANLLDQDRGGRPIPLDHGALRVEIAAVLVMVVDDHAHIGTEGDPAQITQPRGGLSLDHHERGHRIRVHFLQAAQVEQFLVQAEELRGVAVGTAREHGKGMRIEAAGRDHRREGVEVRAHMRGDHVH